MSETTIFQRRIRILLMGVVIGLLIQTMFPVSANAATPAGPDIAPASTTKPATTTGSGTGKEKQGATPSVAKTPHVSSVFGAAVSHMGTPTKTQTNSPNASPNTLTNLQYYPLSQPIRFYDSRPGQAAYTSNGAPDIGGNAYGNAVAGITYQGVTIPASALAVTGNVTVVADQGSGPGFVTLYPNGASLPTTSNANYVNGQVVPNAFTVALGTGGSFRNYQSTTINIILDITGYYAPPGTGGLYYHPLTTPIRLLDTRPGNAAYYAPGAPHLSGLTYVDGVAGITYGGITIPSNATAISGNATVIADQGSGPGFLTLFPDAAALPTVSNNNYRDGDVVPNAFFVGLGSGALDLYNSTKIDVVVDISGYFSSSASDSNGTGVQYNTLPYPIRMFDSRPGAVASGSACFGGTLGGGSNWIMRGGGLLNGTQIVCQGVAIPTSAVAVTGNATVVADLGGGPGFVTLFPATASRPNASNLNYVNGQVAPNLFVTGVGPITAGNSGNVYTNAFLTYSSTSVDEIFDLNGYFA